MNKTRGTSAPSAPKQHNVLCGKVPRSGMRGEQFSICFRDDISPQPCSPSKYHDGEERKRSWLSALCWDAEDKFSTPRCALSYLINFQRGDATNLTTLAIKRRRRKRMTLTKINRFYFRKTFDKAQLWFSYTI